MNTIHRIMTVLALATLMLHASETSMTRIHIPVDPMVDRPVEVVSVPFYTSGAFPEIYYYAITLPYFVKQGNEGKGGDINLASQAGISLSCECIEGNASKLSLTWDFTKAKPKILTKEIIEGILLCIEKSSGEKTKIFSKFKGEEKFLEYKKIIEAKIPMQMKPIKMPNKAQ